MFNSTAVDIITHVAADGNREQAASAAVVQRLETTLPEELRQRNQWVVWRLERRINKKTGEARKTKVLYQPGNGRHAKANDPATWSSFADACAAYLQGGYAGIGYVFSKDDPYVGTDLDHYRDTECGAVATWAQEIVNRINSYAEVSPSGTGIHSLSKATLPRDPDPKKDQSGRRKAYGTGAVEVYSHSRFFTMTGNHLEGTPRTIEERQEAVMAVYRQVFGDASTRAKKTATSARMTADRTRPAQPKGRYSGPPLSDTELLDHARVAKNWEKFCLEAVREGSRTGLTAISCKLR